MRSLPVAMRTGDWAGVLKMLEGVKPEERLENLKFLAGQLREFASGDACGAGWRFAAAQAASMRLDAELWQMSQKVKDAPKKKKEEAEGSDDGGGDAGCVCRGRCVSNLSIMSLELRGAILAEQKKLPEAKALFDEAAQEEKGLGYREPPTYIRPVGETEGAVLMRAGDYAGAHKAYAAALVERPKSGFPLYGMARSSEAAGDAARLGRSMREFVAAWKDGDPGMPEMAHAREYLGGQKVVASSGK